MKTNQLFILTGLAAIASTSCSQKENTSGQPAKPMNILYIMTDDHSFQTISAYDKRYIQTPNIDRIANEGVRFTNSQLHQWPQPCLHADRQAQPQERLHR